MTADRFALVAALDYAKQLEDEIKLVRFDRVALRDEVRRLRNQLDAVRQQASPRPEDCVPGRGAGGSVPMTATEGKNYYSGAVPPLDAGVHEAMAREGI